VRLRIAVLAAIVLPIVASLSGGAAPLPGDGRPVQAGLEQPPATTAPRAMAAPEPPAPDPWLDLYADVSVSVDGGFLTWAGLDRRTGQLVSSGDRTNTSESMVKPWIVADHLRRVAENGDAPTAEELEYGERAIRDSDDVGAEVLYNVGGGDAVIERMIDMCGLTDTTVVPGWWSRTETTATDAVRVGECLVNGTAAGPEWTDWVLEQMRQVRGSTKPEDQRMDERFEGGHWGVIDGLPADLPADQVAIKNGWTRIGDTNSWHLNCLAVTQDWVLAVLMRYPAEYSLDYGAERCARVAEQLFAELPAQAS
jgi:hypothetical protein